MVLKDLAKHLVDLAYVARSLGEKVDHERVAELVREKFAVEGTAARYRNNGIISTSDLPSRFTAKERIETLLHRGLGPAEHG